MMMPRRRSSSCSIAVLAAVVGPCAVARTIRRRRSSPRRLERPSLGASVRPRRARARHPGAAARRRAHLAAGRPGGRVGVVDRRHAASARSPATSAAAIDEVDQPRDGRADGVSRHPAGDRAGRRARAEPDERRARAVGDRLGGLRAAGARAGAARARARVRAGGARARRRPVARSCSATCCRRRCRPSSCRRRSAWRARSSPRRRSSFLGLGVQPPTPSWGTMLDAGRVAPVRRAAPDDLSRAGDRAAGARLQFPRRWVARPDRSEAGQK